MDRISVPVQTERRRAYQLYSPPPELLRWFDLHFPPSTFQGRLVLGMRREGCMQTLFTGEKAAVREVLEGFYGSKKKDYYITGNEISGVTRSRESCFALTNLVIDLDVHGEDVDYRTDYIGGLAERLLWRLRRDAEEMPPPHSLVLTGRGCQLWWHIRPCAAACLPYYSEVLEHYLYRVGELIRDDPELLPMTVDGGSSRNLVGYFRLPTTYNTAAKTWSALRFPETACREYVLQDLWQQVKAVKEQSRQERQRPGSPAPPAADLLSAYTPEDLRFLKDIRVTAFFRLRQMTDLRILRDRDVGEETRNNLCFIVYNSLLRALGPDTAWQKLLLFNQGFKKPMTEKELQGTIVSCQRVGGYKYRNASIIKLLEITPEEQIRIGLYPPDSDYQPLTAYSRHPGRNAERALRRQVKDRQISQLSAAGKTAAEIARELGIGRHQAEEKLKAAGGSSVQQRQQRVMELLAAGKSPTEIAAMEGCCLATVRNIRKRAEAAKSEKNEAL